jgi:hypothetical protein
MTKMADRSTPELLVLMIAGTICGAVVVGGAAIIILAFLNPDADFGPGARAIADLLSTMVGLLAGFLAGRTDLKNKDSRDERE